MKIKYIFLAATAMMGGLISCNKMLDKEPISIVTPENYLTSDTQLRNYLMPLYENIIGHNITNSMGMFSVDTGTDNCVAPTANKIFVDGLWQVETDKTKLWNFDAIYKANYFLKEANAKYAAGKITGIDANIKHCIGEGYFFRAYATYRKWIDLGDFPIIKDVLPNNMDSLVAASRRMPRNEVARFMMEDLDKAAELMLSVAPDGGRRNLLSKNVALLLKSRIALIEGTWLKNFAGTAFVPNGEGWPGADKEYNKGYQFPTGSIEKESEYFLEEAYKAADLVASSAQLATNNGITPQGPDDANPYFDMFGAMDMSKYPEILLWRDYDPAIIMWKASHGINYHISKNNKKEGMTRGFVMSFLDRQGLPWYAPGANFTNDDDIFVARLGKNGTKDGDSRNSLRDLRISLFLKTPGQKNMWINNNIVIKGAISESSAPPVAHTDSYTTGYCIRKGINPDGINCSGNGKSQNGAPCFRASEALLNYIEAYYTRHGRLDDKATTYWEKLRTRAGITPGTIQTTIKSIRVEKEAKYDWAAYTAGKLVNDPTLFAIRKERRCEFMFEALRLIDLRRWRAMDQMILESNGKPYHPQGMKLWSGVNYDLYPDTYNGKGYEIGKDDLITFPNKKAKLSKKNDLLDVYPEDGDYIYPFRRLATLNGFNGMVWKMAHYLSPIEMKHISFSASDANDLSSSPIYQNPYWPYQAGGTAEK